MNEPFEHPTVKVTVFIPVYNGERFLAEAIDSVLAQTYRDFELLIVDDGSTDGSVDIVRRYGDPRIRLERNERNRGGPYTRNRGLQLAKGEYLAVLDADDVCEPHRLEQCVAFLDCHPEMAAVGSAGTYIDEEGRVLFVVQPPTSWEAVRAQIFIRNCFLHSSVMFRRAPVLAIGGYDERLPYAQDYDLFLRLGAEHPLANLLSPLVRYRVHREQVSQRKLVSQRRLANRARLSAYVSQRGRGLIGSEVKEPDLSLKARLRGREGTIGADYLFWARVNLALGNSGVAARMAARAVLSAPLSKRAWRTARRTWFAAMLPEDTRNARKWYARKALRRSPQ